MEEKEEHDEMQQNVRVSMLRNIVRRSHKISNDSFNFLEIFDTISAVSPPPPVPERIVFPFQEILFIPGSVTNNCLTRIYRRTRGGLRLVCVFGYWQRTHSTPVERKAIDLFLEKRVKNFVNKKIYVFFFIFLFFFC